jgi:hypothetical protein
MKQKLSNAGHEERMEDKAVQAQMPATHHVVYLV